MADCPRRLRPAWSWLLLALLWGCGSGVTEYNHGVNAYQEADGEPALSEPRRDGMARAAGWFEQALAKDPTFAEAYWNLGLIQLEELNEPENALGNLEAARKLFTSDRFVATAKKDQPRLLERVGKAIAVAKKLLGRELSPEDAAALAP